MPAPQKAAGAPAWDESVQAIEDDYQQEILRLDRRRLERLARLAASQNPADAGATYEHLFRLAIGGDLFRDAEEPAKTLLKSGNPSRTATALAHLTKIIAEADRGAYDESLESLGQAIAERNKAAQTGSPRTVLPTGEILAICDAYYQRLIHAGQYETAQGAANDPRADRTSYREGVPVESFEAARARRQAGSADRGDGRRRKEV